MHSISGTDITLTRGDSLLLQIDITRDSEPYTPAEGDSIRFAMKQKYKDPDSAVKIVKTIPTDTLILEIEPEDTKDLLMGKTYVYDIQLTDANGRVDTFINGNFTIDNEVI